MGRYQDMAMNSWDIFCGNDSEKAWDSEKFLSFELHTWRIILESGKEYLT